MLSPSSEHPLRIVFVGRYTKDLDAFLNGNSFAYTVGIPAFAQLAVSQGNFGSSVNEKVGLMPKPYGVKESSTEYQGSGGTMSPLGGYNLSVNPNSNKREAALEVICTGTMRR